MYLKSMLVTSLLAASCLFADSGASVMINPETATEELSANGQSLIYRDIHVNVNDLKQNSIWKTSENANNELNTDAKTRIYYTKGGTIVGEECKDSTMINGCSGMRPFVIYEDVVTKASETGEPVVLTFQTPVGSTGNEVLQYFQSIDSSAKASTFWPMASNRIVDHNGNPMQIMRTSGTLISDYIKGVFNMPNLSNKDQRLISVKHKENIHFGLTKYKSETIKEDIEKGNAKLKNIYFMPDFWKNPESEGVHTLLSQPVKGNRPDALGILNYGAGCHRDLFGPIGFFVSDNLDSESEACKALRADNDFKDMETEIEMDTLIALVSAVDEHLISRDRKTFCDWMFGRTPEGEKYIDPVTGRTIYLDISASYDFSSEEDNVIMEVPVTDGSKIVDTSYLRINKIVDGISNIFMTNNIWMIINYKLLFMLKLYFYKIKIIKLFIFIVNKFFPWFHSGKNNYLFIFS